MDNQNQNPVTPPATQNDLPVSEIVSALKSAPPLQEITPPTPPITLVVAPAAPIAPTPPAPSAVNPLAEDPDQVIAPGSK